LETKKALGLLLSEDRTPLFMVDASLRPLGSYIATSMPSSSL
jgi:hypothetical protein